MLGMCSLVAQEDSSSELVPEIEVTASFPESNPFGRAFCLTLAINLTTVRYRCRQWRKKLNQSRD
jgi:hypothetical protein